MGHGLASQLFQKLADQSGIRGFIVGVVAPVSNTNLAAVKVFRFQNIFKKYSGGIPGDGRF